VDSIIYNSRLQALAKHYGFTPRGLRALQRQTKGKVEHPFRYVREDFNERHLAGGHGRWPPTGTATSAYVANFSNVLQWPNSLLQLDT
jgi:hypothetical protein